MRILPICLAIVSACALAPTPLVAAPDQQQPPTNARPPAPPPSSAAPAPAPAPTRQTPGRPGAPAATAAARRAPNSRGVFSISGLMQPAKASFTDARDISYFRETATRTGRYDIDGGYGIDVGAFARVWRNLGLGVSVSRVSRSGDAAYSGSYPHPFFFAQPRTADTIATSVDRNETGVHVSAAYLVTSPARFRLVLFAGPSFFSLSQDVVEEITATETYPYDTLALAPGARSEISKSLTGFHGGADVSWYFSERVGVGALARYTTATKSGAIGTGQSFDLEAGGFQAGLGLRVRF
ncbi:MAG: outer membrane beta-barrel protein [Acidobacteria bacterium]|nr:outer membrane beta-barrel protein [Acidobacteriota bacterium]